MCYNSKYVISCLHAVHTCIIYIYAHFYFSVELEQMLNEQNIILSEISEKEIQKPFGSQMKDLKNDLYGHSGSGSGGYADFIFRYAVKQLFEETRVTVEFKNLRNPDFQEAVFQKDGQTLLTFAIVNGFRNIQNLVQKLKRGKCTYDYVEVMACPCGKTHLKYIRI